MAPLSITLRRSKLEQNLDGRLLTAVPAEGVRPHRPVSRHAVRLLAWGLRDGNRWARPQVSMHRGFTMSRPLGR